MRAIYKYVTFLLTIFFVSHISYAESLDHIALEEQSLIRCANLIYSGTQSSVCFSDKFLGRVSTETNIKVSKKFTPVKLSNPRIFQYPFSVMSGEGDFVLDADERRQLKKYLSCGGFLMASPGCSNAAWSQAFRREIQACFPKLKLKKIPFNHPLFSIVYNIPKLTLKSGQSTHLEGLELNGRIVLIFSPEGLNDVKNAKGCCCCGGNEIKESQRVNVNIFTYSLLY